MKHSTIYDHVDAANVDLKAFRRIYGKITLTHLEPVLKRWNG